MKKFLFVLGFLGFAFMANAQNRPDIFQQLQRNVWYLPTDDRMARLYVTSLGKGDTVVALHGGPGNDFNYLVDAIRGNLKHHTFILFDQRGSLLSPVPDSRVPDLTLDQLVEDVETLRKALGMEKLTLFGHSFGTLLAISYYQKYPDHVRSIILAASVPPYATPEKPFKPVLEGIRARSRALRTRNAVHDEIRKAGLTENAGGGMNPRQSSDVFKIQGLASMNVYHIENWRKFIGGNVYYNPAVDDAIGSSMPEDWDIRLALAKFPVPVTVIQGDQDYIDPAASLWVEMAGNFRMVKVLVIRDACHYSWLDDPDAFDRDLKLGLDRD